MTKQENSNRHFPLESTKHTANFYPRNHLFDILHIYYAYKWTTFVDNVYIIPIYSQILHIRFFVIVCFWSNQTDSTLMKSVQIPLYPYM